MGVRLLDDADPNWAGERALITHSKIQYRAPALTGEVTVLTGAVTGVADDPLAAGHALVTVEVEMRSHTGTAMAKGPVEVRFPR